MKTGHVISSFTGGELSPRLDGRIDLKRYASGCRVLENFTVVPHGGARKRSGTKFVIRQKSDSDDVVLHPYQYNTEQSYILCFGPLYIWFFKDGGIITNTAQAITGITQDNPAVVTCNAHGYSNGDTVLMQSITGMTEVNNRHFTVAGVTANTFQLSGLNSTALTAYASDGTAAKIVTLTTDYAADDLADIQITTGINDVVYVVHKDYPLRKIVRASHTSWTLEEPTLTTGPFRLMNADLSLRITPSFTSRTITGITAAAPPVITSAAHGFSAGDRVLIRNVVSSGGGGYVDPGYGGGTDIGGSGGLG